jgi:hypothetical protein
MITAQRTLTYRSPLIQSYIAYRNNLLSFALKLQIILTLIASIAIPIVSKTLSPILHNFAVILSIISIPTIYPLSSWWLRGFQSKRWKRLWPNYDFSGDWSYSATFSIQDLEKNSQSILFKAFHDKTTSGNLHVQQDVFECSVRDARESVTFDNNNITGLWRSGAMTISSESVEWGFRCTLHFSPNVEMEHNYVGYEFHEIQERAKDGRPLKLVERVYFRSISKLRETEIVSSTCVFSRSQSDTESNSKTTSSRWQHIANWLDQRFE